jgi:hypothetical protein
MDRALIIGVFLAIQAAAVGVACRCYQPVCEWMTGGSWLSPAIRVPLVMLAVVFLEMLVLAAVWPCNRLTGRLLGRGRCPEVPGW